MRFNDININLLEEEALGRMASVLGTPIEMNNITATQQRIRFARVLVEMKADSSFPKSIPVVLYDGRLIWQNVSYEWIPPKCDRCVCFGHNIEQCPMKTVWKVKGHVEVITKEKERLVGDILEMSDVVGTSDASRNVNHKGKNTHVESGDNKMVQDVRAMDVGTSNANRIDNHKGNNHKGKNSHVEGGDSRPVHDVGVMDVAEAGVGTDI